MRIASAAVVAASLSSAAWAEVATLSAVRDATLYEDPAGLTANGAGQHLFAGRTNSELARRGLVAFDVSGIRAGATITGVSLTLHHSLGQAPDIAISLHRAQSGWTTGGSDPEGNEGGGATAQIGDCTWLHSSFDAGFWTTPGGDFESTASATAIVGATFGFRSWSSSGLVADVQGWLDGSVANHGWFLLGPEQSIGTSKRFDSSENAEPSFRPVLTIEYVVPNPGVLTTISVALMGRRRRRR